MHNISVVIAVHDQAAELRRNLPRLLTLTKEPGMEVIVVDESSTDDTLDVLKQLAADHPQLYVTYIPATSHYLSRRKLALTIGIKAAHNEWVLLTQANCHPKSEQWFDEIDQLLTDDTDAVCVYTNYEEGTKGRYVYLRMFDWWRQKRCPRRYNGACLALRKSAFMARNGFLNNLAHLRGEYDFLINETACTPNPETSGERCIAVVESPLTGMQQEEPSAKQWASDNLYYMDTRRHLKGMFMSRLAFVVLQLCIHLVYLFAVAALAYASTISSLQYIMVCAVALLLHIGWRTWFGYRLCKRLDEHIALWKLPLLDLGVAWHYAYYWLRYNCSDKYNFQRK